MTKQILLSANDISEILGMSKPYCYKLIARLNKELEEKGYMVVSGKINRNYFEQKLYGFKESGE